ncbi:hypothetical protein B0H13DRAFT_2494511 [Mycena leptocephala]|nr:hypothetical protein B0H13DRAFT_2494511 [Mycena leptocephala]
MTVQQPMAPADSPTADSTQQIIVIPALSDALGSSTSTITFDASSGAARTAKPKQRSSAARRASHNAIERLRRENLNSRFLDLAALFPNLANIRRPSKSSIVNTCIAHVHASRRHRFLASQQVRVLRDECDSLRREVNEWRERAGGIMLLPPPNRGEGFAMILAGAEFELEESDPPSGEGEEEDYGDDDGSHGAHYTPEDLARLELYHHQRQQHQQQLQYALAHAQTYGCDEYHHGQFQSPFAHDIPAPLSAHSAGIPDHPWHEEHPWHDDHNPLAPQSAHEPVMRHPYMHRLQTGPQPHASQEQLSPLFPPSEYPYDPFGHHQLPHGRQVFVQDEAQKWEFVAPLQPTSRDLHRQSTR